MVWITEKEDPSRLKSRRIKSAATGTLTAAIYPAIARGRKYVSDIIAIPVMYVKSKKSPLKYIAPATRPATMIVGDKNAVTSALTLLLSRKVYVMVISKLSKNLTTKADSPKYRNVYVETKTVYTHSTKNICAALAFFVLSEKMNLRIKAIIAYFSRFL